MFSKDLGSVRLGGMLNNPDDVQCMEQLKVTQHYATIFFKQSMK